MKKKITILLILVVAVFSAHGRKPVGGDVIKIQSQIGVDSVSVVGYDEDIDYTSQTDTDLAVILQQLGLKELDCKTEFISHQISPVDKNQTIWVIPKIASLQKNEYDNQAFDLDRYLLLVDTKTNKIVSQNYKPNAWSSDAYRLNSVAIDGVYPSFGADKPVISIASEYRASSSVNPTGNTDIELFIQEGDSLRSFLTYTRTRFHGENDGQGSGGAGFMDLTTTELFCLTNKKIDGFYDIALITFTEGYSKENIISMTTSRTHDSARALRYTSSGYEEIPLGNTIETICDSEKNSQSGSICSYFGKSLSETYIKIFEEDKISLQKWMLTELPTADIEYTRNDSTTGDKPEEVTIKYTLKGDSRVDISFLSEIFLITYSLEQKDGFVNFEWTSGLNSSNR